MSLDGLSLTLPEFFLSLTRQIIISEFEPSRIISTDLTRQYSFLGLTLQDLSRAKHANFIFVFSLAAVRQRGDSLTAVRHGGGSSTAVRQGSRVPSTDIFALK